MLIVFNFIVIGLLALIAYWWANQGAFSAILHLLCVIVAGAVALAFWEPLAKVLIRGTFFDDYAWGVTLVALFVIALLVLRILMDRLVPANVDLPRWANLSFGGFAGAAAGVISVGIFITGAGFVQSHRDLLGFRGFQRRAKDAQVAKVNGLWVPVHKITDEFYGWLSVTSLRTPRPLRQFYPELYRQTTLVRDSFGSGKGKLSLQDDAARIEALYLVEAPDGPHYFARIDFTKEAIDWGEMLTLSSSQVRLIGAASGTRRAAVAHPIAFEQESGYYRFDHTSHYATSAPGTQSASATFEFAVEKGFNPAFVQIRGNRYRCPAPTAAPPRLVELALGAATEGPPLGAVEITAAIEVTNVIRNLSINKNTLPAGIEETDRYLSNGCGTFSGSDVRPSKSLRIEGIYEPEGTKVVKLDVSRGSPADIFGRMAQLTTAGTLHLIDSAGREYAPFGYIHFNGTEGTTICLRPVDLYRDVDELPVLPTGGEQRLELLFYIKLGEIVTGFRMGDVDVGYCQLEVKTSTR